MTLQLIHGLAIALLLVDAGIFFGIIFGKLAFIINLLIVVGVLLNKNQWRMK